MLRWWGWEIAILEGGEVCKVGSAQFVIMKRQIEMAALTIARVANSRIFLMALGARFLKDVPKVYGSEISFMSHESSPNQRK